MKIICTFISDNFSILKNYWLKEAEKKIGSAFYGTEKVHDAGRGGLIIILDWNTKKIITKKKILAPRNLVISDKKIYLPKGNQEVLVLSDDLRKKLYKFSNPHFNSLHWITKTPKGFLFASSGIDLILETDKKGKTLWEWWAIDHGFNRDPKGRIRKLIKEKDYKRIKFGTLRQTTHLNSLLEVGKTKYFKKTIYCSLFHQGKIIAIDKSSGDFRIVFEGLKHPHSIRRSKTGLIFSDTENGRIITTDKDFNKKEEYFISDANWIQDASFLPNGNIIISDSNNNRILEFSPNENKVLDSFNYSKEWKIFSSEVLGH